MIFFNNNSIEIEITLYDFDRFVVFALLFNVEYVCYHALLTQGLGATSLTEAIISITVSNSNRGRDPLFEETIISFPNEALCQFP